MLSTIALITALTSPIYDKGDTVKVLEGTYKDCIGSVLDVLQAPEGDLYDLGLTKCPNRYIKGQYVVEGIPAASLEAVAK